MSRERFAQLEHRRLLQVAREYRSKGYRVQIEPSGFPTFLRELRPDLVALSDDDNVVVEIVSKESIGNRERLEALAASVQAVPGWTFELVVTNPRKQPAQDISLEEVKNRLTQAGQLGKQMMPVAAVLIAWSAVEALLRQIAVLQGVKDTRLAPLRLVKTLFSLGILTRSEYEGIDEAIRIRNAAVHGFDPPEPLSAGGVLSGLLDVADRLVRRTDPGHRTVPKEYAADELVEWFSNNYEDPANGVPYDEGYIYVFGGPYDAWDELSAQFPDAREDVIEKAVEIITQAGIEWVRRGQY